MLKRLIQRLKRNCTTYHFKFFANQAAKRTASDDQDKKIVRSPKAVLKAAKLATHFGRKLAIGLHVPRIDVALQRLYGGTFGFTKY